MSSDPVTVPLLSKDPEIPSTISARSSTHAGHSWSLGLNAIASIAALVLGAVFWEKTGKPDNPITSICAGAFTFTILNSSWSLFNVFRGRVKDVSLSDASEVTVSADALKPLLAYKEDSQRQLGLGDLYETLKYFNTLVSSKLTLPGKDQFLNNPNRFFTQFCEAIQTRILELETTFNSQASQIEEKTALESTLANITKENAQLKNQIKKLQEQLTQNKKEKKSLEQTLQTTTTTLSTLNTTSNKLKDNNTALTSELTTFTIAVETAVKKLEKLHERHTTASLDESVGNTKPDPLKLPDSAGPRWDLYSIINSIIGDFYPSASSTNQTPRTATTTDDAQTPPSSAGRAGTSRDASDPPSAKRKLRFVLDSPDSTGTAATELTSYTAKTDATAETITTQNTEDSLA